ncbi:MAG: DUF1543 domain-containing protein [Acidimicrobiales bacterium]
MQLYAAFLGGALGSDRMGEDHEVVFVVAEGAAEAKQRAKAKWRGAGHGHVDAVARLEVVDGYRVEVTAGNGGADHTVLDSYN